jgi:outer membrane lipoprotein carrier protein
MREKFSRSANVMNPKRKPLRNHIFVTLFIVLSILLQNLSLHTRSSGAYAANIQKKTSKPHTTKNSKKDDLLERTQAKYRTVKTLTAEFTQLQTTLASDAPKVSSGRIFIKRPDKFRWQTTDPDPSILVGNGKKVWYYTPPFREGEKGQVLTKRAIDVQSKLAIDLLAGTADTKKDFKVNVLEDGRFQLSPIKPAGDIDGIELFIERSTNLVYKLVLFTKSGNKTELTLKDVTLGLELKDELFNFTPPANTEEIH